MGNRTNIRFAPWLPDDLVVYLPGFLLETLGHNIDLKVSSCIEGNSWALPAPSNRFQTMLWQRIQGYQLRQVNEEDQVLWNQNIVSEFNLKHVWQVCGQQQGYMFHGLK